jgi:hypothetical protein
MKQKTQFKVLLLAALTMLGATYTNANEEHDHSEHATETHQEFAAPNGGRLITSVEPHLEFFVTPERFVQITFIGDDGAVVPVADQVISAIGGDRSAPTKVAFVEEEGLLISTEALPEMANMPILLQIKVSPEAKAVRERFKLNMSNCSGCGYEEYACTCGH